MTYSFYKKTFKKIQEFCQKNHSSEKNKIIILKKIKYYFYKSFLVLVENHHRDIV